jgi:ATP-binding cassette subfamily G (WHITE) protein 2 (PDR)
MHNEFRGQCVYEAEIDVHFPLLTVQETLEFAAECRASPNALAEAQVTRNAYADAQVKSAAESLGLHKALETQIGNDFIPGISGGERKRTSIAEILVGNSALQCWDNPTRGLDSENALQFIKALSSRTRSDGSVALVSLYQTSEDMFNMFDKVIVLHDGHEIFFGPTAEAKPYFARLGFQCEARTPTPEFLTSVTDPYAKVPNSGYAKVLPRSGDEFAAAWIRSPERTSMLADIETYEAQYPLSESSLKDERKARRKDNLFAVYDLIANANSALSWAILPETETRYAGHPFSDHW